MASSNIVIGKKEYQLVSDDDYLAAMGPVFEPHMVRLFESLIDPDDTVLDIGANVGCTAILFGGLAARVWAFEPSPSTYGLLERNLEHAGAANVLPRNIGLGAESATAQITFAPNNRSGGFVSTRMHVSEGHVTESIVIETCDLFVERNAIDRVDFMKIDVEGFEADVIRGAAATLARFKPTVVMEMNHWCLNVLHRTCLPDFLDFMRARFPILLAIEGETYLDLHDPDKAYQVMYRHINMGEFKNLVGGFDEQALVRLRQSYRG